MTPQQTAPTTPSTHPEGASMFCNNALLAETERPRAGRTAVRGLAIHAYGEHLRRPTKTRASKSRDVCVSRLQARSQHNPTTTGAIPNRTGKRHAVRHINGRRQPQQFARFKNIKSRPPPNRVDGNNILPYSPRWEVCSGKNIRIVSRCCHGAEPGSREIRERCHSRNPNTTSSKSGNYSRPCRYGPGRPPPDGGL